MPRSAELPVCFYPENPPSVLIAPCSPTPRRTLYLSNLDDQNFLRFTIKYLYLFRKSTDVDFLKKSLSRVLVDYYPLAGRLRKSAENDQKLEVECNGEGAVFAQAFMDITADEFTEISHKPNVTFRKLLYKVEAPTFLDIPPVVVQVTNLRCGGMILCIAINHALCDGVGTSEFLNAWAHLTTRPNDDLPITPLHCRHVLKPRSPPQVIFSHRTFTRPGSEPEPDILKWLESQPLVSSSLTFNSSDILRLKTQCVPSLKCTAFEVLASHTWRCWLKSLDFPPSAKAKLLFSANIRKKIDPEIPPGYYGNAFVLACAEGTVKELLDDNLRGGVKLVQHAKSELTRDYVKSVIDHLEDKTLGVDLSGSLVISAWSKLGLEDLDFGEGKPLQMGSVTSNVQCLFLPVAGEDDAVRVLLSMPGSVVSEFEYYMTQFSSNGNSETTKVVHCDEEDHEQVLKENVLNLSQVFSSVS